MVTGFWGKKIGMTQIFKDDKVVPVTAINTSNWIITNIKNNDRDGYNAVQVGYLRSKYTSKAFDGSWLKNLKKYFSDIKEIKVDSLDGFTVGNTADFASTFAEGSYVDVIGLSKGCGFAGAVKRHNFRGGCNSHGDKTGRRTGSQSFMRSRGRVIKGKRLPGHMGTAQKTIKNLEVVKINPEERVILVKGSVPGKSGSLVFLNRCE